MRLTHTQPHAKALGLSPKQFKLFVCLLAACSTKNQVKQVQAAFARKRHLKSQSITTQRHERFCKVAGCLRAAANPAKKCQTKRMPAPGTEP